MPARMIRPMKLAPFATLLLCVSQAAFAADPPIPNRVERLEKEMRAVQRKVFPGGAPAFSEPEIAAPEPGAAPLQPASQPINELSERVSSLERALSQLTNQVEQDEHRLQLLSDTAAKDRAEFDARLKTIENPQPAAPAIGAPPAPDLAAPARPGKGGKGAAKPLAAPVAEEIAPAPPPAKPAASTGDPGEDAYMAGYQLWADKHYDEASAALQKAAKDYPRHKRASYARNLAGRAELDAGKPATAAQLFLQNYQSDPKGDRAAESLFYLGQSLTQLKKTDNACRAYDELESVYGKTMSAGLKGRLPAARKAAGCKAPAAG